MVFSRRTPDRPQEVAPSPTSPEHFLHPQLSLHSLRKSHFWRSLTTDNLIFPIRQNQPLDKKRNPIIPASNPTSNKLLFGCKYGVFALDFVSEICYNISVIRYPVDGYILWDIRANYIPCFGLDLQAKKLGNSLSYQRWFLSLRTPSIFRMDKPFFRKKSTY